MTVVDERGKEGGQAGAAEAAPENPNDNASAPAETLPPMRKSAAAESDEVSVNQQIFSEARGAAKQDSPPAQDALPKSPSLETSSATTSAPVSSKTAASSTSDCTRKNLSVSLPDSQASGMGTNAFTQLVRGWESFMKDQQQSDPFANMKQHMLHGLSQVPGAHHLDQGYQIQHLHTQKSGKESSLFHPMAHPAFRYTQSTPSRHTTIASQYLPSILQMKSANSNAQEDDVPPPPIALDPFQRSTSTPSAFRQHSNYSAFGTADNSAFTHPLQRSAFSGIPTTSTSSEPGAATVSSSAFGPAQFYSMALEDMERTSIEVEMEDTSSSRSKTDGISEVGSKRGAASRAARFLSDVRVLRRRRKSRNRDGRENPAQPPSVASSASKEADDVVTNSPPMIDTAVTVITEPHFNPNDSSMLSASSEVSAIVRNQTADSDTAATDCEETSESTVVAPLEQPDRRPEESKAEEYHELDYDMEEANYQRIETQLEPSSPSAMSPSFQNYANERPVPSSAKSTGSVVSTTSKMKVKVSSSNKPRFSLADSPSPTGMERGDGSSLTPRSVASSRSSVTGSSSGHTTQATNNSSGTSNGRQSGLSTISETDREVMEANKEAKRRNLDSLLATIAKKTENDGTSTNSGSSNSTNPHRYFSLAGSPDTMREGANVPVAQLLATTSPSTRSPSPVPGSQVGVQLGRAHTIGTSTIASRRSLNTTSPSATSGSISAAHTNSSGSSSEQPPKFVSYVDEEAAVLRGEFIEDSSRRTSGSDGEEREASPAAQMLGYSDLSFEEPLAPSQVRSSRLFRGSRRRPPRSPGKGSRMIKTPPPRGSVSPLYHHHQLSPPPDIVDHPDSRSNVSRPHVMRSGMAQLRNPVLVRSRSDLGPTTTAPVLENSTEQVQLVKGRTYRESSIEITNADAVADAAANVVSPEK